VNISRRGLMQLATFSILSAATMSFATNAETTAARQAGEVPVTADASEVRCVVRGFDDVIVGVFRFKKAVINEIDLPDGRKFSMLIVNLPPQDGNLNVPAFNVKIYQKYPQNLDGRLIKDINITDKTEILSYESLLKFFIAT